MKGSVVYSPVMQSQTEMELHSIIINHPHPHYHQSMKIVFVLACAVVALFHGDPSSACPLLPFLGSKFASKPWVHCGPWAILERALGSRWLGQSLRPSPRLSQYCRQ